MPELPEVETTVRDLNRALKRLSARFLNVWTDAKKIIKKPKNFGEFRKKIKGKEIKKVWRRGKNIILELSGGYALLVHQKMTGHLLCGKWQMINGKWQSLAKGPLAEKVNSYIHLMFRMSNGLMLALSDLRKFAKVELWETEELKNSTEFKKLGPEPLEKSFTLERFREIFRRVQGKGKGSKIKKVLLDQGVIAGIGNIYADEILWRARVHPLRVVADLNEKELGKIYSAIKKILQEAVKLRGTSVSDFRDPSGKPGLYGKIRKVYQKEGEKCPVCNGVIKRIKIGGRSAHFCPSCQLIR